MSLAIDTHRLVHLDLKSAPIQLTYLEKLIPLLAQFGATGLLIEWEDTFPYSGALVDIGSRNSVTNTYTSDEISRILHLAQTSSLIVIPLVQTIGHLEFVLKHPRWRHLREVTRYPSCLCPSKTPAAVDLVTVMIDQVIQMHPNLTTLHIGADEVWNMGQCDLCSKQSKHRLFLDHIKSVVTHVRNKHPSVISLVMWDDMLRSINIELLQEYNFWDFVEPMVWHYQPAEFFQLNSDLWKKYSVVFKKVWVASAFKGATGSCQILPVISHHISNHEKWSMVLADPEFKMKFLGIALTGWSRFDHFAILCELLPVAIPSLALCLRTWIESFSLETHRSVSLALGYSSELIPLDPFPRPQHVAENLNFPSWQILTGVGWFANFRSKYYNTINSDHFASWLNPWQRKNNHLNPMQTDSLVKALHGLKEEIQLIITFLKPHLLEVYHRATVEEWFGSIIEPICDNLAKILESLSSNLEL
nr:PREDICTED: hexosaminidase D-like [Bemisia tabaci]XP_018917947.1 PREDICTED: hexosaminidase D-like [Bemisia tabaci]XP_018917948.1 PREDICTED: hexosaminidase D-like [Bemisia tabaci]XP_018917949.1 PREDICTED: hexosaminidase D-like [Bemisia tabaci]XP_018917950.1 PREDICTED: hexosaminidase D-like [Bemisia tabaci]XP_018917951.1 PREDICTED: hexosaminidase D-like [Bemisia tabaci]